MPIHVSVPKEGAEVGGMYMSPARDIVYAMPMYCNKAVTLVTTSGDAAVQHYWTTVEDAEAKFENGYAALSQMLDYIVDNPGDLEDAVHKSGWAQVDMEFKQLISYGFAMVLLGAFNHGSKEMSVNGKLPAIRWDKDHLSFKSRVDSRLRRFLKRRLLGVVRWL